MTGEGCWHDHLVMRFVQGLVYHGMVKALMDAIKAQVSEADEERQLHIVTESKRGLERLIVQSSEAANFEEKER